MAYNGWQATVQDDAGNAIPLAEITVREGGPSGDIATIYSDTTGTAKANPFFATVNGFAQFFAAPGTYYLVGALDGQTTDGWYVSVQPENTAPIVLRGTWDASAGTFPGSGTAQVGDMWIVSVGGTVDAVSFAVGNRITALANNASTTTYVANWFKEVYSVDVTSVQGRTGAVVLVKADVGLGSADDTPDTEKPVSAAQAAADAAIRDVAGIVIPVVGDRNFRDAMVHFNSAGDIVAVIHDQDIYIPQIGNAEEITFTPFGVSVDYRPAASPATDVEVMPIAGTITGRVAEQLHQRKTDSAWVPLTNGPNGVKLVEIDAGAGTATVRRKGYEQPVKWRTTALSDGATMHMCVIVGQSLAQGYTDDTPATNGAFDRYPAWRDLVGERAWQFKAGDGVQRGPRPFQLAPEWANRVTAVASTQLETLEPLRGSLHAENPKFAQTTAESLAAALISQHLNPRDHVLTAIVGTGSTPIADFAVGTPHMASVDAIITAAAAQAAARGKALKVWLIWNQGEQDNAAGTVQATYEAAWIVIRNHIQAGAIAAGGTYGGAVIQQCSQRPASATGMATLAHAALIAAGEAAGVVHYPMLPGHSGAAHLFPESYLPLGSQTAWAISRLIEGSSTTPYIATGGATLVDATTIDCVFSNRSGAMQFDTTTIPDNGSYGVKVTDGSGTITVSTFTWTGDGTLRLTLASPTTVGANPIVGFGTAGSSVLLPGETGPRVNIRDSSEWPCPITGQIVSGWVLQHQVAVVAA